MRGMSEKTYPVSTIAKLLMLSETRVQQLVVEGVIEKEGHGKYNLVKAVQGYIKYLQDRSVGNAGQVKAADYHVEKARKIRAEATLAEMEVDKKRGLLVEVASVEREATSVMLEIRTRMLAVPERVAPSLLGETNEREIKKIISEEIEQALTSLADASRDADDEDTETPDDE